jgi:putative Mg2+ transporter-C (MgtC) family protein
MPPLDVLLLRLMMAIVIGGLIGVERELKSKSAGFRTIMLICVGSFLFTTFSQMLAHGDSDRIAANIVTGIGFLGAGVIFKGDNRVNGLTTAATIWVTAALGMGVATGYYLFTWITTAIVLISLFLLMKMETRIDSFSQFKTIKVTFRIADVTFSEYESKMKELGLESDRNSFTKNGAEYTIVWNVKGRKKCHEAMANWLLTDERVIRFES